MPEENCKFKRPKILIVDGPPEVFVRLQSDGWNVQQGSFGPTIKFEKSRGYASFDQQDAGLPNYQEQDVFIIDPHTRSSVQLEAVNPVPGERSWYVEAHTGVAHQRCLWMSQVRGDLDRILKAGGVFIVYCRPRDSHRFMLARRTPANQLEEDCDRVLSNFEFLTELGKVDLSPAYGQEFRPVEGSEEIPMANLIAKHLEGCTFSAVMKADSAHWVTLFTNKFGESVAAARFFGENKGLIILLPELARQPEFFSSLMGEVLPALKPELFPSLSIGDWVHEPIYELSNVLSIEAEIQSEEEAARRRLEELRFRLSAARQSNDYLYDLLRETNRALVIATMRALEVLGFKAVVDVDEVLKSTSGAGSLREDLRIADSSPELVVDIKGVGGTPADHEAMQSYKHVNARMKETGRTDVQGLSIVNHQRHLPALDRENEKPFRDVILANAENDGFGLLTSWDLFRLVRGKLRNGWSAEQVKPVLYRVGRIKPYPTHYVEVGVVGHVWKEPKVFSVITAAGVQLTTGNKVAFEFEVDFVEQDVRSIEKDRQRLPQTVPGCDCGVAVDDLPPKLRPGIRIFALTAPSPAPAGPSRSGLSS